MPLTPPAKPANHFYVMRHGQSEANRLHRIVSDPEMGRHAYGLTAAGRRQVRDIVRHCRDAGHLNAQTIVVTSDFKRAVETSQILASGLTSRPIRVDARLRERHFGAMEGTSTRNYLEIWERDLGDPTHHFRDVESCQKVWHRMSDALSDWDQQGQGRTIVLVTHGDSGSILRCGLRDGDLRRHHERYPLDNAELCALIGP